MTGLATPLRRWSPSYSDEEFEPQLPEPFDAACAYLRALHGRTTTLLEGIDRVTVPSWTGSAGDGYRSYLASLRVCAQRLDDAIVRAARAIDGIFDDLDTLDRRASTVADLANQAQALHARESHASDWQRFQMLFTSDPADEAMDAAMRAGRTCLDDLTIALGDLTARLNAADEELSAIVLPPPPGHGSPVLLTALGGVAKAEARDGEDAAAQAAMLQLRVDLLFGDADAALDALKRLSPAELAWVLDHLSEEQAGRLLGGLDPQKNHADYEWLARHAGLDALDRLAAVDPNHYWQPPFAADGSTAPTGDFWQRQPIGPGGPSADPGQLHQGGLGDCHLLSSLAAVETAEPGFLAQHVHANSNGTYTVTMYHSDGSPFTVTVTPDMPADDNGSVYAHGDQNGDLTDYQIYEKAFAQAQANGVVLNNHGPGYEAEQGGFQRIDTTYITGHTPHDVGSSGVTAGQLQHAVDSGQPVTVATKPEGSTDPIYNSGGTGQYLITGHAYYVMGVDSAAHPPTVTLGNPWGQQDPRNGTVTVPLSVLQGQTSTVTIGGR